MDDEEEEYDPLAPHTTLNCHVSSSQEAFFCTAPVTRHNERFSSGESPPPPAAADPLPATTVDLGRDSESHGLGLVARSTVVIESGTVDLGDDLDEFMVVERETRDWGRERMDVLVVDLGGDQVFDQMPVRNEEVRTGQNESIETADLGEDNDFIFRKRNSKMGLSQFTNTEAIGLDENHDFTSTELVDLDEDEVSCDVLMRNSEINMGPHESNSMQIIDFDENQRCNYLSTINRGVENRNKIDELKGVGHKSGGSVGLRDLPSSGQTENDQIMKNILDALGLVTEGEKANDDASDEEVDIFKTAVKRGMNFPKPRWWPPLEFGD